MKTRDSLFVASLLLSNVALVGAPRDAIPLWGSDNLEGWTWVLNDASKDPRDLYRFSDAGELQVSDFAKGYFRTEASFESYRLHIEWRWSDNPGNGGILIHLQGAAHDKVWPICFQFQLKREHVGELIAMEGATVAESIGQPKDTVPLFTLSSERPVGEWNSCEIVAIGDTIEFYVNDVLQNRATHPSLTRGQIGLQLEGAAIEYRNAYITQTKP